MPPRPPYGLGERNAANYVVASGNLSGYLGEPGEGFLGGPKVRDLEAAWRRRLGVKYAVAMNSATSCLFGAVQAVTEPREGVLVTPWSMSASAVCVREARCEPIFRDIDPQTYAMQYSHQVHNSVTAIVLVHLFGCPAHSTMGLRDYALNNDIALIEDACQAPGAMWQDRHVGTIGKVGIFSLNRHKQIQAGEGGIAVTDDEEIAAFLRGFRNHGENGNFRKGYWGGNYRLGEVEAAIGEVQLGRLDELVGPRIRNAAYLDKGLAELDGVVTPFVPRGLKHVYYLYAVRVPGSAERWGQALTREGVPAGTYVKPLYRLPVLSGFVNPDDGDVFPEVERAYREVVVLPHIHAGMMEEDLDDVISAFQKVWKHREEL